MAFKYKIKEAPAPNLARDGKYKMGDVTYSKDGDTKFVVNKIDKETGQVGWDVIELPSFEKLNETADELVATAKKVYTKTKDDEKFREIYEDARLIRNKIRKHLRNEYPDEYKRMAMQEATGVDGDVVDLNPQNLTKLGNYVKLPHHFAATVLDIADEIMDKEAKTIGSQPQIAAALRLLKTAAKKAMTGEKEEKEVEEMSTSGGAGAYLSPYAFRKKGSKAPDEAYTELGYTLAKEGAIGDGADLGPGPKAGPDGVTDNAYVKQFKYQLVPKNKKGNYVQKGSGLEVKNLFSDKDATPNLR